MSKSPASEAKQPDSPAPVLVSLKPYEVSEELRPRIEALGLSENINQLRDDGYTVIKDAVPLDLLDELREDIHRLSDEGPVEQRGRSAPFLLGRSSAVDRVVTLPKMLAMAEFSVGKGMRAGQMTASIKRDGAGSFNLPPHADQSWMPAPFPEHNMVLTFCVPCEGMTAAGGATGIVPGSNQYRRHVEPGDLDDVEIVPIEAEKGSVAVWDGSVWHSSPPRTIPGTRTVLHATYQRYYTQPIDDYTYLLKDEEYVKAASPEMLDLLGAEAFFGTATPEGGVDMTRFTRAVNFSRRNPGKT
jgi:hypothetical protein